MWKAALLTSTVVALDDLQRARTKVPSDDFRAHDHPHSVARMLTSHLEKSHSNTKPCNQFTALELQELQTVLHSHHQSVHNDIYSDVSDTRALRFGSLGEYQDHWTEMNAHAATHPNIHEMQRDGHCLEAVMWWTHHLSESSRKELSHLTIPRMPHNYWREPTAEEGESAKQVYSKGYHPSSTCLSCHGGGVEWQSPDNEPPPFPRQVNNKDRARRCDEYYGEDVGECNACEGMAGHYWGDMPDYTEVVACEIVGTPDDIPVDQRTPTNFPTLGVMGNLQLRCVDRMGGRVHLLPVMQRAISQLTVHLTMQAWKANQRLRKSRVTGTLEFMVSSILITVKMTHSMVLVFSDMRQCMNSPVV